MHAAGGRWWDTGYPALSAELPAGGLPVGALVDLLVHQPGVGELRLLRPALSAAGNRPIAFVQPSRTPDGLGLSYTGLSLEHVLRVKAQNSVDHVTGNAGRPPLARANLLLLSGGAAF